MNENSQLPSTSNPAAWERSILERLAFEALAEQRLARRWQAGLSISWLVLLFLILFAILGWVGGKRDTSALEKHTALVELKAVIASDTKASADKIFVDKASIVGSIGVLMDGSGFTGTMEKLGVERRFVTAGDKQVVDFTEEDSFSENLVRRLGTSAADSFWTRLWLFGTNADGHAFASLTAIAN